MARGARRTRALERPGPMLQRERPVLRCGRPADRISGSGWRLSMSVELLKVLLTPRKGVVLGGSRRFSRADRY
jgi:hypothetical protein